MGLTKGDDFNGPMGEQKEVSDCGQEGGGERERGTLKWKREREGKGAFGITTKEGRKIYGKGTKGRNDQVHVFGPDGRFIQQRGEGTNRARDRCRLRTSPRRTLALVRSSSGVQSTVEGRQKGGGGRYEGTISLDGGRAGAAETA
jgi:hypothetical protein